MYYKDSLAPVPGKTYIQVFQDSRGGWLWLDNHARLASPRLASSDMESIQANQHLRVPTAWMGKLSESVSLIGKHGEQDNTHNNGDHRYRLATAAAVLVRLVLAQAGRQAGFDAAISGFTI